MRLKLTLGVLGLSVLTLGVAPRAEAGVFATLTANAVSTSCDNGLAVTAVNCGAGWTIIHANNIFFTGVVDGYTIQGAQFTANVPGGATAFSSASEVTVTHAGVSGATLQIDFGAYDFTSPNNPLSFSSSQSANWTNGVAGDSSTYTAWARSDNGRTAACGAAP